jgi:autotransporter-associated beta strand protein
MALKQFLPEGELTGSLRGQPNSLGMSRRTISDRRRQIALRLAAVAGIGVGIPAASAGTFTFSKTAGGTFGWNNTAADGTTASTNWTVNTGPGLFPNGIGDTANLTANITADTTVNLNVPITVGVINFNDASNAYNVVANGGSLTLNNGGAGAQINVTGAITPGHSITSGITLADNLVVTQTVNVAGQGITFNGTISADSGARTITLSSLNITQYTGSVGNITINSDLTNGGAGGTLSLAQRVGAGTAQGITTLGGANTYSGGTTVTTGTLKGVQTTGTPFGTGSIAMEGGILILAPATVGGDVALSGASATPGTTVSYIGGATIGVAAGSNNSATYTIGNSSPSGSVLNRIGNGTLIIRATAINNLGVPTTTAGAERLIVNGGVPLVTSAAFPAGAMVNPTIIGQAGTTGDYLTYGANGFTSASANYTTRSSAFTPTVGEISNITASTTVSAGNPLAIRTNGVFTLTINAGATVTVGSGSGPAGVILNGGTIAGNNATTSVLDFGSNEAVVYTGANSTISAKTNTTGGLTKFGPSSLTISSVNNTISGGVRVNSGTLALTDGAVLGPTKQTLTLMPQTTLDLANSGFDGDTFQHDIILNGARTITQSNYTSDEPQITGGGSSLATARLLSGILSSGTTATTAGGAAGVTFRSGWIRLGNANTLGGLVRLHDSAVIAENNLAFGTTTGVRADGVHVYHSGTVGVRGGVTITNEAIGLQCPGITSAFGTMHAFPNLDGAGSQTATWTGPITLVVGGTSLGAEPNTTLRIEGAFSGSYGYTLLGGGTVELVNGTSSNGTSNLNIGLAQITSGTTLRVVNTSGGATGGSLVEALNGTSFTGNGAVNNAVVLRSGGTIAPGTPASTVGTLTLTGSSTTNFQAGIGATYPTTGNLQADAGSHVAMELTSTAADQIRVNATGKTASIASPIEYSVPTTFAPAANSTFDLILADVIGYDSVTSGGDIPAGYDNLGSLLATYGYTTQVANAASTLNPGEYKYYIATNAVSIGGVPVDSLRLQVGPVPEPSAALGTALFGGIGLLRRRRRRS